MARSAAVLIAAVAVALAVFCPGAEASTVQLKVDNSTASNLSLMMINDEGVAGYQFKLTRVPVLARVEASAGPLTKDAAFIFDFNEHGEIVLSFSLTGQTIPERSSYGDVADFAVDTAGLYCFDEFVFSNSAGDAIEIAIEEKCMLVQV